METKHVFMALGAGVAVGTVGAYVYRRINIDDGHKPLPLFAHRSPGAVNNALEVDPTTGITKVRTVEAAKILKALEGRELDPLPDMGKGEQASFGVMKLLDPKMPVNLSAGAWLALAAKAGFDVLVDERLTALAKGNAVQVPFGWETSSNQHPTDVIICRRADTQKFASYPSAYAVLIPGDPAGSGAFPAPPSLASVPQIKASPPIALPGGSTSTDATKAQMDALAKQAEATIAKEVSAGPLRPYWGG